MRPYKCQQRFQIPNARIGTDTLNNVRGSSGPQANTVLHGPVPQDAAEKACHKRVSRTGSLHYRNIVAAAVKGQLRRFAEAAPASQLDYHTFHAALQEEIRHGFHIFRARQQHRLLLTGKKIIQVRITWG